MKKNIPAFPDCRYQKGVQCGDQRKCDKCGWNPAVRAMRVLLNRDLEASGNLCRREVRK